MSNEEQNAKRIKIVALLITLLIQFLLVGLIFYGFQPGVEDSQAVMMWQDIHTQGPKT